MKNINVQNQNVQWTPSRINAKKFTPIHTHQGTVVESQRQRENLENSKRK